MQITSTHAASSSHDSVGLCSWTTQGLPAVQPSADESAGEDEGGGEGDGSTEDDSAGVGAESVEDGLGSSDGEGSGESVPPGDGSGVGVGSSTETDHEPADSKDESDDACGSVTADQAEDGSTNTASAEQIASTHRFTPRPSVRR